jgi:PAS domain-containing protein
MQQGSRLKRKGCRGRPLGEVRGSNEYMSTLPHFEALGAALAGNRYSAVIYARADGGIGFWNAGAEALFGHSKEEALGKPST